MKTIEAIDRVADSVPIRYLISDVDGTLVTPDKVVTPATREAVKELRDAGIGFAFVSSRPPKGLASIAEALSLASNVDADRPACAAFNGGALLDARLKPLSFAPLEDADAQVALDALASMCIDAWVFTLDEWLIVNRDGLYVAHEQKTIGFPPRVVEHFDGVTGIGKIVGSSEDPALLERASIAISRRLSTNAHALLSQAYYLDITHARANKGSALRAIAEHAGLALDEIAAIGDMTNDLAMLEIAGYSIAMGNAPDAVKAAVDAVTASNREDGFAKAVREILLPRVLPAREGADDEHE